MVALFPRASALTRHPPQPGLVAGVLDNLAAGLSAEEIVASSPPLRVENVRAATAYAAEMARERVLTR